MEHPENAAVVRKTRRLNFGHYLWPGPLGYISVDERCHHEFYKRIALLYLERDRQATLEELRLVLQTFAMPALHMLADSRQRTAEVKSLNIYNEDIFFRDVLRPVLAALGVGWSEFRQRDPQRKSWATSEAR